MDDDEIMAIKRHAERYHMPPDWERSIALCDEILAHRNKHPLPSQASDQFNEFSQQAQSKTSDVCPICGGKLCAHWQGNPTER